MKLDENMENGPLNMEILTLAMVFVIAIFCKESPQHLIIKKPNSITIVKRNKEEIRAQILEQSIRTILRRGKEHRK